MLKGPTEPGPCCSPRSGQGRGDTASGTGQSAPPASPESGLGSGPTALGAGERRDSPGSCPRTPRYQPSHTQPGRRKHRFPPLRFPPERKQPERGDPGPLPAPGTCSRDRPGPLRRGPAAGLARNATAPVLRSGQPGREHPAGRSVLPRGPGTSAPARSFPGLRLSRTHRSDPPCTLHPAGPPRRRARARPGGRPGAGAGPTWSPWARSSKDASSSSSASPSASRSASP